MSPLAIDEVLLTLGQIRDAAAFGVPDGSGLMQIRAAIVPKGPAVMPVRDSVFRQRLPGTRAQRT